MRAELREILQNVKLRRTSGTWWRTDLLCVEKNETYSDWHSCVPSSALLSCVVNQELRSHLYAAVSFLDNVRRHRHDPEISAILLDMAADFSCRGHSCSCRLVATAIDVEDAIVTMLYAQIRRQHPALLVDLIDVNNLEVAFLQSTASQ